MATYTAGDQINRALRLLGVLAEGETPSAETSSDALMAFNQMIDSWSTERLSVYAALTQVVTWPAGQATRTLGPTGNLPGTNVRPVFVDEATFYRVDGIDYPLEIVSQQQYDEIAQKDLTGYPRVLFVNPTYPDAELTLWPVPEVAVEVHVVSARELTQPATLSTTLSLPPGYLRALTYNLACELAPEFGTEPSGQVQRVASVSKRDLKRLNQVRDVVEMPLALRSLSVRRYGYNINEG